jgi:cytochrome b pre-mRNA-processing protein 3
MSLASLFHRNRHRDTALRLYEIIVERAREPVFFTRYGVPDTLDGRFELLALHGFLVLNRLKKERSRTAELAQQLFDIMFSDLDRALREMGVGDLGVGRQVKTMAKAFYGRIGAYEAGLTTGDAGLGQALRRNLFGTVTVPDRCVDEIAAYVRDCAVVLAAQPVDSLIDGVVGFTALPGSSADALSASP